jgi:UDP-GlcNAc:undecaprenyl-phosphate GlcNAc-1-phosphate transferase
MTLIFAILLSLFLTIVLTPVFSRLAMRLEVYDVPEPRKVHQWPIPRVGGLAMAIGVFASIILWAPLDAMIRAYLIAALILVASGIIDDWKGLGFKAKFAAQISAALIAILYGDIRIVKLGVLLPDGMILAEWLSALLTLVVLVGVTNAINLSDGLDGLAGGICMLLFCCIGYLAYVEQNFHIAIVMAALVGAIFGFLRFNTFPATLFMGDTGSQLLGFSAIYFSLALTQGNTALSPLLPLIILGFPVLDTLTVMGERIAQGHSPFLADKNHFHHRLMRMGLFHTESVFFIYVIQTFLIVAAFVLRFYSEWLLLVSYLIFAGLVLAFFHWADAEGWKLPRFKFIDRIIKGRLRVFRERGLFIMLTFRIVEWGVPLLLLITCFLPASIPSYFSAYTAVLLVGLFLIFFFRKSWMKRAVIVSLYLFIPGLIYLSDTEAWMKEPLIRIYNLSFLFFLFLVLVTLRLTKRAKGFKLTPMDFLVLFITVVFLALPELRLQYGLMAVKTIILFFCYEIIMGEVREKIGKVAVLAVAAYLLVVVRGIVG